MRSELNPEITDAIPADPLPMVRIYADPDGVSHFSDDSLPFRLAHYAPPAPPISKLRFQTISPHRPPLAEW